jgi:hypothetical protein
MCTSTLSLTSALDGVGGQRDAPVALPPRKGPGTRIIRGVADKSLARPTSLCRRTESIVSLERGVCSCAELQVFSC